MAGALVATAAAAEGLRDLAARSFPAGNVVIGVAAHGTSVERDDALRAIVRREFAYVTPANDFKQSVVNPNPDSVWNWALADRWLERIGRDRQLLRIHAPIGPQVSTWMKDDRRTPAEIEAALEAWIPALCGRYAGKPGVRWLDVVNETAEASGEWTAPRPGVELPENPWLALGLTEGESSVPVYVIRAFELANRHCGNLKLIINQHLIDPPAVARLKQLVMVLRARGLRVDGIGWQAHVEVGWETRSNRPAWFTDLVDWTHQQGLEFHVTENNVYRSPRDSTLDLQAQARTFASLLRLLLERRDRGFVGWTLWHARDDQTDNKDRLGCLWDNDNRPKPAYFAVRELLASPPPALPRRDGPR